LLVFAVTTTRADFREDLAVQLGTRASYLVLNLPPRPGAWPGTIYSEDMRFPLVITKKDHSLAKGPEYSSTKRISLAAEGATTVSVLGLFDLDLSAATFATTELEIQHARTYEITVSQIRSRIDKRPKKAPKIAAEPTIVYRSYEGQLVLHVSRRSDASTDLWMRFLRKLASARLKAGVTERSDVVTIATDKPFVFAFEVEKIRYFACKDELNCSSGTPSWNNPEITIIPGTWEGEPVPAKTFEDKRGK